MLQGIRAVAFDLDGTLYPNYRLNIRLLPFLGAHARLLIALARARSIIRREQEKSPTAALPDFYERQARIAATLLRAPAARVQEQIDRLIYRGWERHFAHIPLFPHAGALLAALQTAGIKRGLLSDFPPLAKLSRLGIADCWDAVVCSECTGALKPAMPPFRELSRALDTPPEQILYVGNSRPYDIAGAARAGMKTALRAGRLECGMEKRRKSRADFMFHDYRQLRDFVLQ